MECDFDRTATNGSIVTKYHFIDYERQFKMDEYYGLDVKHIIYGNEKIVEKLKSLHHVLRLQGVEQTCTPARQFLHELDSPFDKETNHACQCKRYTTISSAFKKDVEA